MNDMQIDVFNGDADGICALIQLRLAKPLESRLITGAKRDICLLDKVTAQAGDRVTVLDISLAKNIIGVKRLLTRGVFVFYVDHHQHGTIPTHPHLHALIDTDANVCTSLLVDNYLMGKYRQWAITAAFGDNLHHSAQQAAASLSLSQQQLQQLKTLGTCINYNSYGDINDLHFAPDLLYRKLLPYVSPFDFIADNAQIYQQLLASYDEDMAAATRITAEYQTAKIAVFLLPDSAWARRVGGVFNNALAYNNPNRAHAVVSFNRQKSYQISVRAPLNNKTGADKLCTLFPTGGGRIAAAGINHLPVTKLPAFIAAFALAYP